MPSRSFDVAGRVAAVEEVAATSAFLVVVDEIARRGREADERRGRRVARRCVDIRREFIVVCDGVAKDASRDVVNMAAGLGACSRDGRCGRPSRIDLS